MAELALRPKFIYKRIKNNHLYHAGISSL